MEPVIVDGDLLDQEVDAIVNAWNRNIIPWWMLLPHGVSGAIKRRAGLGPFWELGKAGPIPLGGAVLTGPGRLPCKGIIHVAGISMFWVASERSIRASVASAMLLVRQHGFRSVAFPIIGAGVGGREATALSVMMDALRGETYDGQVVIVCYRAPKRRPAQGYRFEIVLGLVVGALVLLAAWVAWGL